MVVDVDKLTDDELRTKLLEFGFPVMPITGTTRKVMVKKLRLLLENKSKGAKADGRMSLGRYSSEEESDGDVKPSKKEKNRRATMAAPTMQPPLATRNKRSPKKDKVELPEVVSPPRKTEVKNTSSSTTVTRTHKILQNSQDDFDTGSDSESDIVVTNNESPTNHETYSRNSPIKTSAFSSTISPPITSKYAPPNSHETSYSRSSAAYSVGTSPSRDSNYSTTAAEYAAERLNQIRSRLNYSLPPSYEKPTSSFPSRTERTAPEETPFLSNFTRRLSALTTSKNDNQDYKNDIIKENDGNGATNYSRTTLHSYRKNRSPTYDYKTLNQNKTLKNNFVSFAVLAGAALFFIFLTIMYLGMKSDTAVVSSGYKVSICSESDHTLKPGINCVRSEEVTPALQLLDAIKPELLDKAIKKECSDSRQKAHISEQELIHYCKNNLQIKDDQQISRDLRNLEVLTFTNAKWGISIIQIKRDQDTFTDNDVVKNMEQLVFNYAHKTTALVILQPSLPWTCKFYNTISMVLQTCLVLLGIFAAVYFSNLGYKFYKHYQQKEKDEIGIMVERIIDVLQTNAGEEGEHFVVINHVRDMILPVVDRERKEKIWKKAVRFINDNESRVRTEEEVVKGEPCEVWKWIGNTNLSMSGSPRSKSWQGQAFETQMGSVNSLPCSPTPCLKIRGMVEDSDRNTHIIKDAVLSKCSQQCRILHCAVETNSNCVYIKCADTNDAAVAYRNLHGWWFAGQLVTVKYLRLERYMQRFPDSPVSGPPYLKAIAPPMNWAN